VCEGALVFALLPFNPFEISVMAAPFWDDVCSSGQERNPVPHPSQNVNKTRLSMSRKTKDYASEYFHRPSISTSDLGFLKHAFFQL
jgi:hypothetical protein